MRAAIQTLILEGDKIHLFFDQARQPSAEIKGQVYTSLPLLFRSFPHLSRSLELDRMAQLVNFLLTGLDFQYIESIEQFRESYLEQLESDPSRHHPHLADYGLYNISLMHPPLLVQNQLVFFVKDSHSQVPYKVSIHYPITALSKAKYELLPYI